MTEQRHQELAIHPVHPHAGEDLLKREQIVRRTWIVSVVVLILLGVGAGRTLISRSANAKVLEAAVGEHATIYVKTAYPKSGASQTLALPGTLQGYVQAPIAARASGYVRRWTKDIGSRVQKGELLAEIETPELDQQLSQGAAARAQAASSLDLAVSTKTRWEALRQKDAVSQQELDERRSNEVQARANLAAAEANVDRLRQVAGFKRVVAPFSGVVIRRNIDVGDLIDAGANRPLFVLAQIDTLRIYVNVPQAYAHLIKVGQQVPVTQSELRGQTFKGEIARTSGAIDTASRTMQVEISLPNKEGILLPGAYVQAALPLTANQSLTIPANALMMRGDGMRVAVVDSGGVVRLKQVRIGRNYGEAVELLDGVTAKDQLVLNPADSMAEGTKVTVAPAAPAKAVPGAKAAEKEKS
jgi:RND family efflux transporter MFP subunit